MLSLGDATDLLHLLGDGTRLRLLSVLREGELSVAELTAVTELSQSRVSTHLGKLREAGLLIDRREGTSTFYRVDEAAMPAEHRAVWTLVTGALDDTLLESDRRRADAAVRARTQGARWHERLAGEMERHYSPGRTWEATTHALPGLMQLGDVLDVGAGDGTIAAMLAGRSRSYTCLDQSARMLAGAVRRLEGGPPIRCVCADMHDLPFADACFDQVLLLNVLTYAHEPPRALCEAARVLRPCGLLTLVTLDAHGHKGTAERYQHVHLGFPVPEVTGMLEAAGLAVQQCAVTSRERRAPHFHVITAFAAKPASAKTTRRKKSGS